MEDIKRVKEIVKSVEEELRTLTLNIHDNPELGHKEFKACAWQIELLRKYGFTIEDNFCDFKTAYKATYIGKKKGPKIVFLCEYDALPNLGHGCGHNLIAMVGCGAGIVSREFADNYGAEIYVIGTPAEETEGTKVEMSRRNLFKEYDVVLMAHPSVIDESSPNSMAIDSYKVEFFGRAAHAAASPQYGINALDAMISFFNMINALRQQTTPDARLHGIITNGGAAPNIIPDYTSAIIYVRANRVKEVKALSERVRKCAEGAAIGTGCTFKMEFTEANFMDTCTNQVLNDLCSDRMEEVLGHPILRLGAQTEPGSSDIGDVSYQAPSVQMEFKIGNLDEKTEGAHTKGFCKAAGSEEGINSGLRMVETLSLTAIDIMTKPDVLERIKEEFSHINDN